MRRRSVASFFAGVASSPVLAPAAFFAFKNLVAIGVLVAWVAGFGWLLWRKQLEAGALAVGMVVGLAAAAAVVWLVATSGQHLW